MRNFEAAWFDIDGTLSPNGFVIPHEVKDVLRQIPKWGTNSARRHQQTLMIMDDLKTTLPSINCMGTEIWSPEGELRTSFPISSIGLEQIIELIRINRAEKIRVTIVGKSQRISYVDLPPDTLELKQSSPAENGNLITNNLDLFINYLKTRQIGVMTARLANPAQYTQILNHARGDYSCSVNSQGHLQFTAQGVDKGSSLLWLCRDLGIDPATVLTAGNDIADEPMFTHTYGVQVGTAELQNVQKTVENPHALATFVLQVLAAST